MERHTIESSKYESEHNYGSFLLEDNISPETSHIETAKAILAKLMKYRRFSGPETDCMKSACPHCIDLHLFNVLSAVEIEAPITLVLPAFPGKSPNLAKVFGPLPDMAERCALEFLQQLCDQIKEIYSQGAQIILCSDGRVFNDIIGIRDDDVSSYQNELSKIIKELNISSISTFNLDELYSHLTFDQMRTELMNNHGEQLELLRGAVSRGNHPDATVDEIESHRLFCGITRFLLEDSLFPGQTKSKTALQKESRSKAYKVIQRSKAWGNLVAELFPHAVRLSIHPQTCGAKKLGIRLIDPDNWITPWHGVAVEIGGKFMLAKRSEVEKLGAKLIHCDGRPSHFILKNTKQLLKIQEANLIWN